MRHSHKYWLVGILSVILGSALFGGLIIFVTPKLYYIHPMAVENPTDNESEPTPFFVNDTILLTKDSLVSHKISVIPMTSQKDQAVSMENLGTFGDSAGFWNAIFSALAMIGVLVTIIYQSNKDRHEEERASIAQFQEQCLTMLSMLSDIVDKLRINPNKEPSFNYTISKKKGWTY